MADQKFDLRIREDESLPMIASQPWGHFRYAVIERGQTPPFDDGPGNYILLGPGEDGDGWQFYVGMVSDTGTFKARLDGHIKEKGWWTRALVVARKPEHHQFQTGHAKFAERMLWDDLNAMPQALSRNGQTPGGAPSVRDGDDVRDAMLPSVRALLRLIGYGPGTTAPMDDETDDEPVVVPTSKTTIKDLLAAGLISPNAPLLMNRAGMDEQAKVLPNGRIDYKGKAYDTPSGAGIAARGGKNTDGWFSWQVVSPDGSLTRLRAMRAQFEGGEPAKSSGVAGNWHARIKDAFAKGYLAAGETLHGLTGITATINADTTVTVNGSDYPTLNAAMSAEGLPNSSAWVWWRVERDGMLRTLFDVRAEAEGNST